MLDIFKKLISTFSANCRLKIIDAELGNDLTLYFFLISQIDTTPIKVTSKELLTKFQHCVNTDDLLRAHHMHERLFNQLNQFVVCEVDFERNTITLLRPFDHHQVTVNIHEVIYSNTWKTKINPNILVELISKKAFSLGADSWLQSTREQRPTTSNLYLVKG